MRTFADEIRWAIIAAGLLTVLCLGIGVLGLWSAADASVLTTAGEVARLLAVVLGAPAIILALFNHRRAIQTHQRALEQQTRAVEQQERSDLWKRREFVAKYIADFEAVPANAFVMSLLDYNRRSLTCPGEERTRVFTSEDVMRALSPRAAGGVYTTTEARIRDAFDGFLGGIDRLGTMCSAGLVQWADVQPYLQYWLELLDSGPRARDPAFGAIIRHYLEQFHFTDAVRLLEHAGVATECSEADRRLVEAFVNFLPVRLLQSEPGRPDFQARKGRFLGEEEAEEAEEDGEDDAEEEE